MRKSRLLPAVLVVLSCSCALETTRSLRFEAPARSPVRHEDFDRIVILGFREADPVAGFEAGENLAEYLAYEIGVRLRDRASREETVPENDAVFEDPAFWKEIGAEAGNAVFVTGNVRFTQETRKALAADEREIDGPFKSEFSGFTERTMFTLTADLLLISASTGDILFRREYREAKAYENVSQPAAFAFNELARRMRPKFFTVLFGETRSQERTLMLKD